MNSLLKVLALIALLSFVVSEKCSQADVMLVLSKTMECMDSCMEPASLDEVLEDNEECIKCYGEVYPLYKKCQEDEDEDTEKLTFLGTCKELEEKCTFNSDCCSKKCWLGENVCMPQSGWESGHICKVDSDCSSKKCNSKKCK